MVTSAKGCGLASCGLGRSITGAAALAEDEGRILVGDLEHVDFRHFSCLPCTRRHGAVRGGSTRGEATGEGRAATRTMRREQNRGCCSIVRGCCVRESCVADARWR